MSRRLPHTRSVLRGLVALVAVLGVVFGVSACQVRSGAAAFVGDDKISEADVSRYVTGQPSTAATDSASAQESPRDFVLGVLILDRLWTSYLRSVDAVPTEAQLSASRDAALAGQGTAPTEEQLLTALNQIGVESSFAPEYTRQAELQYFVNQKSSASGVTSKEQFVKLIADTTPAVKLSPRYGTWNASELGVENTTPDYLTLPSSAATPAA